MDASTSIEMRPRVRFEEAHSSVDINKLTRRAQLRTIGTTLRRNQLTIEHPIAEEDGRVSNQLEKHGKWEDATTQTDSLMLASGLPSEMRLERMDGYTLRNEMETVMPYQLLTKSMTLEKRELTRLRIKPTLREYKTIFKDNDLQSFKLAVGRKARERVKKERQGLNIFFKMYHDLRIYYEKIKSSNKDLIPIWRRDIKIIESKFGGSYSSYFIFARWMFFMNLIQGALVFCFIILIYLINGDFSNMKIDFFPFVSPWGGTKDSLFFYGGYSPVMAEGYRMDLAYVLVVFFCFLSCLALILRSARRRFLKRFDASTNIILDDRMPFSTIIFSSWDYTIGSRHGVKSMKTAMATALRTSLSKEEIEKKKQEAKKGWPLFYIIVRRFIGNLIVLIMLFLEGIGIYYFIQKINYVSVLNYSVQTTPFFISICNVIYPFIFAYVAKLESYSDPIYETQISIARSYLGKIASIYILLFSYVNADTSPTGDTQQNCWETQIGSEFYQLLWINFAITIITTILPGPLLNWAYRLWKRSEKKIWPFELPDHVLEMIYNESIVWVGFPFSPVIVIFFILMEVVIFPVKVFAVRKFASYPKQLFSASKASNNFLFFLMITLFISAVPVAYAFTKMKPACGPHLGQDTAYSIIPTLINSSDQFFKSFLTFVGTAGFVVPLLLFLLLVIYVLATLNEKKSKRIKELEEEVIAEREDKRYLLRFYHIQM